MIKKGHQKFRRMKIEKFFRSLKKVSEIGRNLKQGKRIIASEGMDAPALN